ncbi:MAG TPA: hypothetical protein VD866_00080 [Urbifossiella sp.]|nr:hypothetical protein [Urbifossiella sp.]
MTTPAPKSRRTQWFLAAVVVLGAAAGGGWFAYQQGYLGISNPADYADPDGVFTARFPNTPAPTTVTPANPKLLIWGERGMKASVGRREYAVTVQDGLSRGDEEISPNTRDSQADVLLVLLASNSHGDIVHRRTVTHDGHAGREVAIAGRDDGKVMAVRIVVGEKCAVRITVHGPGDKGNPEGVLNDAAGFFESVKLGPAFGPPILEDPQTVSAVDLAAAYKSDLAAADGRFKGRWLRVSGKVTQVGDRAFEIDAGVAVRRAPEAKREVSVRTGGVVTATGKCEGFIENRVSLTETIVLPTLGGPKKGIGSGPETGPPRKR